MKQIYFSGISLLTSYCYWLFIANYTSSFNVEQHGIPEDLKFRGNYFLTVESGSGLIEEIKPSFDVEQ